MFSTSRMKSMYARFADGDSVPVDLLVSDGANGFTEHTGLRAFVSGYRPDELVAGASIEQNDTKCIILADDLPAGLRRLERKDRVRLQSDGKAYTVIKWDDKTRRVGANLIAIEAQLRG